MAVRWIIRLLLIVGILTGLVTLAGFLLYARSPVCAVEMSPQAFVIDCSPDRVLWRANFSPPA